MKGSNLSDIDPFDSAPADSEATIEAPKPVVAASDEGKVVLTFKGGRDFDAPWIVIHATSLEDAYEQLTVKGELLGKVMERTHSAGRHFSGSKPAPAPLVYQAQAAPQAAQSAPGGENRFCEHGEMVFKSGVSKAGKPYKLFSCTAPRESQCKAQFL